VEAPCKPPGIDPMKECVINYRLIASDMLVFDSSQRKQSTYSGELCNRGESVKKIQSLFF